MKTTDNLIKIFDNSEFGQIRIIIDNNNNPLFCLADVCKAVKLVNPSSVKYRLDQEDVQLIDLHALNPTEGTITGNSMANFITENGFYDVLLFSDSKNVKKFRKWVTCDILPSIRKHGAYMTPETLEKAILSPDFVIRLANQIKDEQKRRIEAEEQAKILQEENTHQSQVIEGLVSEIPLADMRQRLNQIVRKANGGSVGDGYRLLYKEFNAKFHKNIYTRMNNCMFEGSPMEFIDKEMGMLPELYDLACKLFASTYDDLMKSWSKSAKRAERNRNLSNRQKYLA